MGALTQALCAALLFAFCSATGPASAGDLSPRCPSPVSTAISVLMQNAPDAVVFEFRGRDARVGVRIYNTLPPTGNQRSDRFYIAMRPGFPLSRLLIGAHGCIENALLVDVRIAIAIRAAIKWAAASWI
jgi:hypothetical protein